MQDLTPSPTQYRNARPDPQPCVYADLWLHMRRAEIAGVFTGSSQEGLAQLMNTAGAPMHQFAQMLDFPFLGDEFLRLLADHFRKVRRPDLYAQVRLAKGAWVCAISQ